MARKGPDSGDMSARKKAVPGSVKNGASFNKRSGSPTKSSASGKVSESKDADYGPRKSGNIGAKVGDDGANTRFTVGLPPETMAMEAPEAELPAVAADLAASTLPVPGCDDAPIKAEWGWDWHRDQKLGNKSNRGGQGGGSGANQ